jgi:hypothetical protein
MIAEMSFELPGRLTSDWARFTALQGMKAFQFAVLELIPHVSWNMQFDRLVLISVVS